MCVDYFIDGVKFSSLLLCSAMEKMGVGVESGVPANPVGYVLEAFVNTDIVDMLVFLFI